jgi:predicted RecA/RadA family phage recombinase
MGQTLRIGSPMGDWRSLKFTVTASPSVVHGQIVLVQETVGIIFVGRNLDPCNVTLAVLTGEEAVLIYHAEKIEVPKVTGQGAAFLPGDKVYWDGITQAVTPIFNTGSYWIGICAQPAGASVATVVIDLKGDKATLLE